MKQLSLLPGLTSGPAPLDPPEEGRSSAELSVSLLDRGVALSLAGTRPDGIRCLGSACLEVAPPVRVRSALAGGLLPVYSNGRVDLLDELFQGPLRLARAALAGHPDSGPRLEAMAADLDRAARHLERLLVPRAVQAARAFAGDPLLWWSVYAVSADDETGRLAQLAEVCPGLVRLMLALGHPQRNPDCAEVEAPLAGQPLCEEICAAVVAGQRLGRVLDQTARAWMRQHLRSFGERWRRGRSEEELEQVMAHQRIRIRRAGPRVPGDLLLLPPPPALVPEDIPRDPARNLAWYELTSQAWLPWTYMPQERLSPAQVAGLSRFLSRQGEALRRCCHPTVFEEPEQLQQFIGQVRHYLEHSGRVLNRRTSPARLLDDMDRWVVALGQSCEIPPHTRLRTLGLKPWHGRHARFSPIRTAGELVEETQRMRHCVASMAAAGVAGQAVFLHGEIRAERVTLMVTPAGDGSFFVREARGERDRLLSKAENKEVTQWLRQVNAGRGGRDVGDDDIPF